MKKWMVLLTVAALIFACGCAGSTKAEPTPEPTPEPDTPVAESGERVDCPLEDGTYTAEFKTDSSMFHVNEALDGKGVLTVENGRMTIHVTLASTSILNLYPGKAEDAAREGAELLEPSEDTVDYHDGTTDVAHGFDVPVPALDTDFDLAIIGKKGVWYDHVVSVTNPEPVA